jgi:hypothetical protein
MRKKILLGLSLTTALTAPAAAENWYGIYNDADVVAYADSDSIGHNGTIAGVSLFTSHNSGDYHKQSIEIDCTALTLRIIAGANYGADQQYLSTPEIDSSWGAIGDGLTTGLKGFACDGSGRETYVADPFADADEYWYYYYYDY